MITKTKIAILGIMLIAAMLRFYKLGENPPSIDWDEASLGYNAYSLLKTGKDEYGNSWPVSIRSFNDYKPPAYVYLTIPSVALFGLNEFAVRFPSALAGTISVLITYFLVKELFQEKAPKFQNSKNPAMIAALLLAISPWHLQFSRIAFEANLALSFFIIGTYLLLKAMKNQSLYYYAASAITFILTMYSYHSARVIVPLFLLVIAIVFRKHFIKQIRFIFLSGLLGLILLVPLLITLVRGSAQARFSTVSIFTNPGIFTQEQERLERQSGYQKNDKSEKSAFRLFHHPWLVLVTIIAEGYFDHFDIRFLFLEGDEVGRHSTVGMGLLYFWEFPFLLFGLYRLVKDKVAANKIIFPWLLAAPVASALTTQTPHAVRSLIMLPPLIMISAYGFLQVLKVFNSRRYLHLLITVLIIGNFIYYINLYYIHTPIERSFDWQYGYKQLVDKVNILEDEFDQIIITTDYDQPYIFFLFHKKIDPAWYQQFAENGSSGFGSYIFRKIEYRQDKKLPNRLIVGVTKEIPDDAPVFDKIQFLNGEDAFLLVKS